jgi:hypothetical protein
MFDRYGQLENLRKPEKLSSSTKDTKEDFSRKGAKGAKEKRILHSVLGVLAGVNLRVRPPLCNLRVRTEVALARLSTWKPQEPVKKTRGRRQ